MDLRSELRASLNIWKALTFYEKFEQAIVLVLTLLIALIVLFATWNLVKEMVPAIVRGLADPTDYQVFQRMFGAIFTVIIALEFKHSLLIVLLRKQSIIAIKSVVIIALLTVLRKLIIFDFSALKPEVVFGLAALIASLGGLYWVVQHYEVKVVGEGIEREATPGQGGVA